MQVQTYYGHSLAYLFKRYGIMKVSYWMQNDVPVPQDIVSEWEQERKHHSRIGRVVCKGLSCTASGWNTFALEMNAASEASTMAITAVNDAATYVDASGNPRQGYLSVTTSINDYPMGATPVTAASGNVAAAVATATIAASASLTNYITGFEVTGAGATAASVVNVTVTGTISGTLTYTLAVAAGATLSNQPLIIQFSPAIPASAVNTAIVVSCPSLGVGNTNNTVVAHGYRK